METLIAVLEVVSCVLLIVTLAFVLWRIWASLEALPAAVTKIVKYEAQARAKNLSAELLARLEQPVKDLQAAVVNLSELQKLSASCSELEGQLNDCRAKCAEQAGQLESERRNTRERESVAEVAGVEPPAEAGSPASDQTTPDRVSQEA
jgi:DNA repair ATPase RecN